RLTDVNTQLESNVQPEKDRISSLESIAASSKEQIRTLKSKLSETTDLVDERLKDIEETEVELAKLIELFNEQTNSNVQAPVSRHFHRRDVAESTTEPTSDSPAIGPLAFETDETGMSVLNRPLSVMEEADLLVIEDEVSNILTEKTSSLKELASTMADQLDYLAARPDFYPTNGIFTSPFGYRTDPTYGGIAFHNGIDIANDIGTPIYAAGAGVVVYADYQSGFGYLMLIDHGYGYVTAYAHCDSFVAEVGAHVKKGEYIANMGNSGRTTGPHLHFEIRYNDTPINPLNILE
ncbi:MAG: peptidoglycan DD-metalloendopeptidase family protein, partial [Bacillota bacterium]|nr:peptidoglycan DD-metalloendopeptidase family protein [Bacillota bacterium]